MKLLLLFWTTLFVASSIVSNIVVRAEAAESSSSSLNGTGWFVTQFMHYDNDASDGSSPLVTTVLPDDFVVTVDFINEYELKYTFPKCTSSYYVKLNYTTGDEIVQDEDNHTTTINALQPTLQISNSSETRIECFFASKEYLEDNEWDLYYIFYPTLLRAYAYDLSNDGKKLRIIDEEGNAIVELQSCILSGTTWMVRKLDGMSSKKKELPDGYGPITATFDGCSISGSNYNLYNGRYKVLESSSMIYFTQFHVNLAGGGGDVERIYFDALQETSSFELNKKQTELVFKDDSGKKRIYFDASSNSSRERRGAFSNWSVYYPTSFLAAIWLLVM